MDKVRAFLRIMWVQRFWVLSVVGILVAALCWMKASGNIQTQVADFRGEIDSKFSDMETISQAEYHGNKEVNAKNLAEAAKMRKRVLALWQKLYDFQRDTVLRWPKVLGEDFLADVEKKKFQDPITDQNLRQIYWDYIKNTFNDLVEIVDAKKLREGEAGSSYGSGGDFSSLFQQDQAVGRGDVASGMPKEEPYLVQWLDQGQVRQKLDFAALPTATQIWVTQEDLWVYETLLHIINNANKEKGATRPDNAAIPGIIKLDVGAAAAIAANEPGKIFMPPSAAAAGEFGEAIDMGRPEASEFNPDAGLEGEGASADAALLTSRYVDKAGAPIGDTSVGLGVEYRRLPVRMRLWMNQRWIPTVLVECANAPLPVEVQRVRINASKSGEGFDSSAMMSGGGGGGDFGGRGGGFGGVEMGRGGPAMMGGYEGRGGGEEFSAPSGASANPEMAEVDIYGLVYIFNQPDPAALTVPGEEAAADDTVAATDAAVVR